jgi:alcohol dehydrogenase class IV
MVAGYQVDTHIAFSPNKVILGLGAAAKVADEVAYLRGKKVFIVSDPGVIAAGLLESVELSLKTGGIDYLIYGKVEPEPSSRIIDEGAALYKSESCDIIVGVGGGSSLDVAKGISILAANQGRILDYIGVDTVPQKGAPMILLPTTAGTGSEVTRVLVMTDEEQNKKSVVFTLFALPDVAIIDPSLTISMPPVVTADTGIDALVHAIESYVSMNANVFSDLWAEEAISLIGTYLPIACAKGANREARYNMCLAATLAGLSFTSGGLGAVHALAYPLGTEYHMTHGRTNAMMLPHVMNFNLPGNPEKFARIAELLGKDTEGLSALEAAPLAVEAVLDLEDAVNVSWLLKDYDIDEADLELLVDGAMQQARLFVTNPRDLDEDDVRTIYQEAFQAE